MNFNPQDQREKRQQVFMSSVEWLANILAFATAFLLTPEAYARTVNWVVRFTTTRYGAGFEDLTAFAHFVIVGLVIFFLARATLATAIVAAGLAFAVRYV